ncbi:hypothetical protein Taro_032473 [Colocasia esculenta]|uniref:Pentatricopeptide repeat-containing protein n=1 Tax=Colocasia esculenta TaxID=4460 RepID=A0A843VLF2_COLES|nr:hypothetical protein [Colocasia esculenta]
MKLPVWVYREMEDRVAAVMRTCVGMSETRKIHARILVLSLSQSNFLATKLVHMCAAAGDTVYAELVFRQLLEPNTFLYNAMIRAYAHNCRYAETIALYEEMLRHRHARIPIVADRFTYPFVLRACGGLLLVAFGRRVHAHVCKSGLDSVSVVENSLMEMYTKSDDLMHARKLFDGMKERDAVSWNTLISAHARLGQMKKARALFESMPHKTVISWTALISGYAAIGCHADALDVFYQMQLSGTKPDEISLVSVLPACAHLGALELGRWIHIYADRHGMLKKTYLCNALIEMYAKCGSVDHARQLFVELVEKDVISWSTMIGGLAHHGKAQEAIDLFEAMENVGSVKPNSVTFLGLLSACAHAGCLAKGLEFFDSMSKRYGLTPGIEHNGCMVDLLGRSGSIDQAIKFIDSMPVQPDAAIWGSLLSACKTHGNMEVATIAMEHLLELEPKDTGNYVLLSNIYAAAGNWDGVSGLRKHIRTKSMKKTPGCSLIEVDNVVREFVAGSNSDSRFSEISAILEVLALQLSEDETVLMTR